MAGYVDEKIAKVTLDNKGFTKNAQDTMSALEKLKAAFAKVSGKGAADNVAKDMAKMNEAISSSTEKSNGLLSRLRNIFKRNTENMDTSGAGKSIDQMNTDVASKTSKTGSILARLKSIFRKTDEGNNFSSTSGEIDKLNAKAGTVNLKPLTSAFDYAATSVQHSLSIMDIALGNVLANMMQKAIQFGSQFFRGPADGLNEYKDKLGSIQTIMANTEWEIPDQTLRMRKTSKALEDLNQYADKTIYSFADMTRNIGTFTAAGVGLEDSATAIKGISNLAAVSGSSTLQASTAMYQLSQALSSGRVALQDWNSVIHAGMGGKLFQDRLTAMGEKLGHARDMTKSFRDSLQDGWLTSEVLIATLKEMSVDEQMLKAATEVKSFSQLVGTVQEAIGSGWAQSWEYLLGGFEEAKAMWTNIGNVVNPFLQDDQGTYYDTVLEMERSLGNYRNAMLKTWKDMGGQQALFDGITNSVRFLIGSLDSLREGFRGVIGTYQESATTLTQLTFKFRDFTKSLSENVYIQGTMTSIGRMFGTAFQLVGTVLSKVGYGMSIVAGSGNGLILTFKNIADSITNFLNGIMSSNNVMVGLVAIGKTIGNVFGILVSIFKIAVTIVRQFFGAFSGGDGGGFKTFATTLANITGKIREFVEGLEQGIKSFGVFQAMGNVVKNVFSTIGHVIGSAFNAIKNVQLPSLEGLKNFFTEINSAFSGGFDGIFKYIGDKFSKLSGVFDKYMGGIKDIIAKTADFMKAMNVGDIVTALISLFAIDRYVKGEQIKDGVITTFFNKIKDVFNSFVKDAKTLKESFIDVFDQLGHSLKAFTNLVNAGALILIAAAIAILTLSLKELSKMDMPSLSRGLIGIGGTFIILMSGMKKLSSIASGFPKGGAATMLALAISMRILAGAMKKVAELDTGQIGNALLAMFGAMKIMVSGMKGMSGIEGAQVGVFKMIGLALALRILAGTLVKLKDLSWEEIGRSLTALAGVMLTMAGATRLISKVRIPISNIFSMIAMALMMKVLVSAVADITRLDPSRLVGGVLSVVTLMGTLALATRVLNGVKVTLRSIFALITFAVSVKMLTDAVQKMASVPADSLTGAVFSVMGLLATLSLATKLLDGVKVKLGAILTLITFAGTMYVLALAVQKLSEVSDEGLIKSVSTISGVILGLVGVTHLLKGVKISLGTLGTLITFTAAIYTIAQSVSMLAGMNLGQLAGATTAIIAVIGGIAIAAKYVSSSQGDIVSSLATMGLIGSFSTLLTNIGTTLAIVARLPWQGVLVATGAIIAVLTAVIFVMKASQNVTSDFGELLAAALLLYVIGNALSKVASQPWQGVLTAVVAIGAVIAEMVIAMKVLDGMGGGSALKLIGLALALTMLAAPIYLLSTLNLVAVGVGLAALAGNLTILLIAAALAGPLAPGLAALSGALITFGVSSILAASSILIAGLGFLAFAAALAMLADSAPKALKAIVEGVAGMMKTLVEKGPAMMQTAITLVRMFLQGLAVIIPDIIKAGIDLITNFLNGMAQSMPQLFSAAVRLLTEFAKSIMENMDILVQTGLEIAIKFAESLASALEKVGDRLVPALQKMFKVILDVVLQILKGLVGPILNGIVEILQPIIEFLLVALQKLSDILAPILEPLVDLFISLFENLASIIRSVADLLVSLFTNIASIVQSVSDVIIQIVQTIESVFTTIGATIQSFFNTLQTLFMSIASIVQSVIDGIVGAINGFANVIRSIGDAISSIFQGIGQAIQSVLQGIGSIIESVGSAIKSVFEGVGNAAKAFGEGVKSALQGVAEVFRGIGDGIKAAFNGVASIIEAVGNAAKNAGQGFKLFAQGVSIIAKDGIAGAAGITAVAAAVTGLGSASYAGNLVGFTKDLGSLKGVISGLAGSAGGIMAMSTGFMMMGAALAGLAGTIPTVSSSFQQLQTPITTLAPAIPSLAAAFSMLAPSIMMSASGIMPVVAGFTQLGAVVPSLSAALQTVPAAFQQAAQGAMMFGTSLGQGIMASAPMVIMAVQQLAVQAVMAAQMAFMQGQQIGVQFGQQIAMGLASQSGAISSAAQSGANMSISSVRGTFSQGGSIGSQFGSSIASGISGSSGSISGAGSSAANSTVNSIRGVFNQGTSLGSQFGGSVASGISSQSGSAHGAGSSLAHSAYNGASSVSLSSAGSYAGYGFANGLAASAGSIYATASAIASNVAATIRRALDIHSPSRVTKALGKFTGQGFEIGLKDTGAAIFRTAKGLANQAIEAMNVDDSLSGLLMDNIDMTIQPTVKPVFDGSLLKDMNNLSGKMNGNLTLPSSYNDRFNQNGNTMITNSDTYTVNVNVENRGNQPINPKELARQVQDELKNMRDAALRSRGEEIAW
jgi:tape measure domain-containing protein